MIGLQRRTSPELGWHRGTSQSSEDDICALCEGVSDGPGIKEKGMEAHNGQNSLTEYEEQLNIILYKPSTRWAWHTMNFIKRVREIQ